MIPKYVYKKGYDPVVQAKEIKILESYYFQGLL